MFFFSSIRVSERASSHPMYHRFSDVPTLDQSLKYSVFVIRCLKTWSITPSAVFQAEEKRARNSVPKCPCKLLQPADWPMAGSGSLEGHFGTGLLARFSSAWSNVGCA